MAAACSGVLTESSWVRKRAAFWRWLCDVAVETGAQRFLAAECGGGLGCLMLGGGESGLGLGELGRQGARLLSEAGSLQLDSL